MHNEFVVDLPLVKCAAVIRRAVIYGKREVESSKNIDGKRILKDKMNHLLILINRAQIIQENDHDLSPLTEREINYIYQIAYVVENSTNDQIGTDLLDTLKTLDVN